MAPKRCGREFWMGFIPALLGTLAMSLSLVANMWCESIRFEPNSDNEVINNQYGTRKFGVFTYQKWTPSEIQIGSIRIVQDSNECVNYRGRGGGDIGIDGKWKAVKAFAIMAAVFGGLALAYALLAPCLYFDQKSWKFVAVVTIVVSFFQSITLLLLVSDACVDNPIMESENLSVVYGDGDDGDMICRVDWGYRCNVASVVMWLLMAFDMLCVQRTPPRRPERDAPETHAVTYTQTEQGDGTIVVTEQVVRGTYVGQDPSGASILSKQRRDTAEDDDDDDGDITKERTVA